MVTSWLATAALVSTLAAQGAADPKPIPSVLLPPALNRVLTDYEKAWRAKDASALAALFHDEGFVLATGSPPVRGRAQIEAHYRNAGGDLALRALAYELEGKIGYIIGAYGRTPGGPDVGKFTLTLKMHSDGRWLIYSDMDNGNRRPGNP